MIAKEEKTKAIAGFMESELKCKYREMSLVLDYTKDLKAALDTNDKFSASEALTCRAKSLEEVKACDVRILKKAEEVQGLSINQVQRILQGKVKKGEPETDALFKDSITLSNGIRNVWERIVELDKMMSKRVMGSKSYYEA